MKKALKVLFTLFIAIGILAGLSVIASAEDTHNEFLELDFFQSEYVQALNSEDEESMAKNLAFWNDSNDSENEGEEHRAPFKSRFYAILVISLVITFAMVIYISFRFRVEYGWIALKCGMSRLLAIIPILFPLFGFVVMLVVHSNCKNNKKSKNVVTCPKCGGVHPVGTGFCSICGTQINK